MGRNPFNPSAANPSHGFVKKCLFRDRPLRRPPWP